MKHLYNIRNTIILTTIVKELAIEWTLVILENISESPYVDIERTIEIDIDIRESDTIWERVGISLDQCSEIRITSREETEGIFSRDIVDLHSGEWRRHTREELDWPDLWVTIAILEIDIDRYAVIDRGDESISREYHEEEDMHEEYEQSDDQKWWDGEPDISENIAESIADELHEVIF